MKVELLLDVGFRVRAVGRKLSIAELTNANDWRGRSLYDPQSALPHDCSLAHSARERPRPHRLDVVLVPPLVGSFFLGVSYQCDPAILEPCGLHEAADNSGWFS